MHEWINTLPSEYITMQLSHSCWYRRWFIILPVIALSIFYACIRRQPFKLSSSFMATYAIIIHFIITWIVVQNQKGGVQQLTILISFFFLLLRLWDNKKSKEKYCFRMDAINSYFTTEKFFTFSLLMFFSSHSQTNYKIFFISASLFVHTFKFSASSMDNLSNLLNMFL